MHASFGDATLDGDNHDTVDIAGRNGLQFCRGNIVSNGSYGAPPELSVEDSSEGVASAP